MQDFDIHELSAAGGVIALGPMPGRRGDLAADVEKIARWGASAVLTMTPQGELDAHRASTLPEALAARGIDWLHFAVEDFGVPAAGRAAEWSGLAIGLRARLAKGQRVFVHCFGGCGRSGMAVLRLMVESGDDPDAALRQLRRVRPCAVETDAQRLWATDLD